MATCHDCEKQFDPHKSGFVERHDTRCDQCRYLRKAKRDREYRAAHPEKWKWHFLKERDLLRAYAAGFFDGEGHVFISKRKMFRPKSALGCTWSVHCGLTNRSLRVLQTIAALYDNDCEIREDKWGGRHSIYRLTFRQKAVKHFLEDIMPFLIIKKRQSQLALGFKAWIKARHPKRRYTPRDVQICEAYRLQIRELNAKTGKNQPLKEIVAFPKQLELGDAGIP